MFTRCQACHTVHPLTAALLARGGGKFRCGKCNKSGNALEALFDQWPDAGQQSPRPGPIPTLGAPLTLNGADTPATIAAGASGNDPADPTDPSGPAGLADPLAPEKAPRRWPMRLGWMVGGVLLAGTVAVQLAGFLGYTVTGHPVVRDALEQIGLRERPAAQPFSDVARIELLSRELRTHPARPGVLRLTATIINRASRPQPYPEIVVTLMDAGGRVLKRQRFAAGDYLPGTASLRQGMTPNAYLPFTLEMLDPGGDAVGFELDFVTPKPR